MNIVIPVSQESFESRTGALKVLAAQAQALATEKRKVVELHYKGQRFDIFAPL